MTDLSTTPTVKKIRGAKKQPNSAASKTYEIMKNLPESERTRAKVLKLIGPEGLGLSKEVASVYFYNTRSLLQKEASTSNTVTA